MPLSAVLLLVAAAGLLVAGAELFVENLASAAQRLGVSVLAVAVLLAGAEPEELLTAVLAAAEGRPGLAVGDAIGANVTMLTAALGLAAVVRPLPVGRRTRLYAVGSALAGVLAVLALRGGVSRWEGGLLVAAYVALVALVWVKERTPPTIGELAELHDDDGRSPLDAAARSPLDADAPDADAPDADAPDADADVRSPLVALLLVLAGLALMTTGGVAAVEGATRLVESTGRTDTAVGLTVLGLATTVELFALVLAAARHGVQEVAVAAVVGSAAYNATLTLGAAALVTDLPGAGALPAALLAAALPLAVVAAGARGRLGRPAGAGLLVSYLLFGWLVLA